MADTKFSALTAVTTPGDTDILPGVQGTTPMKYTLNQLTAYFEQRARQTRTSGATAQTGFATDTYLTGSAIPVPAGRLQASSVYRLTVQASKTGAGVVAPVFTLRWGTAGTTADSSLGTFTFAVQTGNADNGEWSFLVRVLTVGSGTSATVAGYGRLSHNASITGFSTGVSPTAVGVMTGFNSTLASAQIGMSANGGTSAAWTVNSVVAELFNLA